MPHRSSTSLALNTILGLVLMVLFFIALLFVVRGVFILLMWTAPLLLIAALVIRPSVVTGHFRWIIQQLRQNTLYGIVLLLATVFGYMLVFPYLFIKALLVRKVDRLQAEYERQTQGELVDYEELDSKLFDEADDLAGTLPPADNQKRQGTNPYERLFD